MARIRHIRISGNICVPYIMFCYYVQDKVEDISRQITGKERQCRLETKCGMLMFSLMEILKKAFGF